MATLVPEARKGVRKDETIDTAKAVRRRDRSATGAVPGVDILRRIIAYLCSDISKNKALDPPGDELSRYFPEVRLRAAPPYF
jgi:hypothetical protein